MPRKQEQPKNEKGSREFFNITGPLRLYEREWKDKSGKTSYFYSTQISTKNGDVYDKIYTDVRLSKNVFESMQELYFQETEYGMHIDVFIENGWLIAIPEKVGKDKIYPAKVGIFINKIRMV